MSREVKTIRGGLTAAQIHRLSPEVRAARAAYISDSGAQIESLFQAGVTELRGDDPDKEVWAGKKDNVESLDNLLEIGYQIDEAGTLYEPISGESRGKRKRAS